MDTDACPLIARYCTDGSNGMDLLIASADGPVPLGTAYWSEPDGPDRRIDWTFFGGDDGREAYPTGKAAFAALVARGMRRGAIPAEHVAWLREHDYLADPDGGEGQ